MLICKIKNLFPTLKPLLNSISFPLVIEILNPVQLLCTKKAFLEPFGCFEEMHEKSTMIEGSTIFILSLLVKNYEC